jgi:hypothetical protein
MNKASVAAPLDQPDAESPCEYAMGDRISARFREAPGAASHAPTELPRFAVNLSLRIRWRLADVFAKAGLWFVE